MHEPISPLIAFQRDDTGMHWKIRAKSKVIPVAMRIPMMTQAATRKACVIRSIDQIPEAFVSSVRYVQA